MLRPTEPPTQPPSSATPRAGSTALPVEADADRALAREFADRLFTLQRRSASGDDEPQAGGATPLASSAWPSPGRGPNGPGPDAALEDPPATVLPAAVAMPPGGSAAAVPPAASAAGGPPPGANRAVQTALSLVRLADAGPSASNWHFGLTAPGLPLQGLTLTGTPGVALHLQLQAAPALRPQDREHALGQLESLRRRLAERGSTVQGVQWSDDTHTPWSPR